MYGCVCVCVCVCVFWRGAAREGPLEPVYPVNLLGATQGVWRGLLVWIWTEGQRRGQKTSWARHAPPGGSWEPGGETVGEGLPSRRRAPRASRRWCWGADLSLIHSLGKRLFRTRRAAGGGLSASVREQ